MSSTLSGAEAAFVDTAQVARLATSMPDGSPHVVPVCPVLDLDRILIASAFDRKVANIRETPAVCVAFDEYTEDWSSLPQVIVFGEAYLVESGPEFERDATLLNEKFPLYPASTYPIVEGTTVIIEIRATRVSSSGL